MIDPFAELSPEARDRLRERGEPAWVPPMLATLTSDRFSDAAWIYERKFDGERCIAYRDGDALRLLSRNKKTLNATYPEVADALAAEPAHRFIVDGEIVAMERGETSFERLQQRMQITNADEARDSGVAVRFYVFDLLYLNGFDTTRLPLRDRKRVLRSAFTFFDPVRLTTHRDGDGVAYYRQACRRGWEGIIAKRADSAYQGRRSPDWLKFKCVNQQELVVGGWTEPAGSRTDFGALLVGYYDDGNLVYAGKVGTGYDEPTLHALGEKLHALGRNSSPFARGKPPSRGTHWVQPELVVEVGFSEWTRAGRLRHPRYVGLRTDKAARQVVRERPTATGRRSAGAEKG